MVCVRGVPGKQEPSERLTAILTQPKWGWVEMHGDRTTTLGRLLIVAGSTLLQRHPAYRTALLAKGRLPMSHRADIRMYQISNLQYFPIF